MNIKIGIKSMKGVQKHSVLGQIGTNVCIETPEDSYELSQKEDRKKRKMVKILSSLTRFKSPSLQLASYSYELAATGYMDR